MSTTFLGIVEIIGRAVALGAGIAVYLATKDVTLALGAMGAVGTVVGVSGAVASIKAQDANPKITAAPEATAKIP